MIHFKCIVDIVVAVFVVDVVVDVVVVVVAVYVDILPFFLLSTEANNNIFYCGINLPNSTLAQ